MQFRLDKASGNGNLTDYLNGNSKICKAAMSEWGPWQEYQKRHAGRLNNIRAGPRLVPLITGHDEIAVNPALLIRRDAREGTVNCSLRPLNGQQFSERFSQAQLCYDREKGDHKKLSPEGVANFTNLLYMEIQYLASCGTRWRTVGQEPNGASGGGGSEAISAGGDGGSGSHGASQSSLSILGNSMQVEQPPSTPLQGECGGAGYRSRRRTASAWIGKIMRRGVPWNRARQRAAA